MSPRVALIRAKPSPPPVEKVVIELSPEQAVALSGVIWKAACSRALGADAAVIAPIQSALMRALDAEGLLS